MNRNRGRDSRGSVVTGLNQNMKYKLLHEFRGCRKIAVFMHGSSARFDNGKVFIPI
jgi:hypothetical protein